MKLYRLQILLFFIFSFLLISCDRDDDDDSSNYGTSNAPGVYDIPKKSVYESCNPYENSDLSFTRYQLEHELMGIAADKGSGSVWNQYDKATVFPYISVVDDGVDIHHPDLVNLDVDKSWNFLYESFPDNFLSYNVPDFNDVLLLESELPNFYFGHGTSVAGIIGASENSSGVTGIAYKNKLIGISLLMIDFSDKQESEAYLKQKDIVAVSNNSWGHPDSVAGFTERSPTFELAIEEGYTNGYGGKGINYLIAAGNGRKRIESTSNDFINQDSNMDSRANFHGVMAICASDFDGNAAFYSEAGANLWVCGYSAETGEANNKWGHGQVATDVCGYYGYNDLGKNYTSSFSGTSGATPVVAGAVGVLRSVYPDLTWRDVKMILASSSVIPANIGDNENDLQTGEMRYDSSSERYKFSHYYGFGNLKLDRALSIAENWTILPEYKSVESTLITDKTTINKPSLESTEATTEVVISVENLNSTLDFIESVQIDFDLNHPSGADLAISLVSENGMESKLLPRNVVHKYYSSSSESFTYETEVLQSKLSVINSHLTLGSSAHIGDSPDGTWKLKFTDYSKNTNTNAGEVSNVKLTFLGHKSVTN